MLARLERELAAAALHPGAWLLELRRWPVPRVLAARTAKSGDALQARCCLGWASNSVHRSIDRAPGTMRREPIGWRVVVHRHDAQALGTAQPHSLTIGDGLSAVRLVWYEHTSTLDVAPSRLP